MDVITAATSYFLESSQVDGSLRRVLVWCLRWIFTGKGLTQQPVIPPGRLSKKQERLKDARLASVIRPDEESNRRGVNPSVLVEFEVLEVDAF
jgi:hypothetical protein